MGNNPEFWGELAVGLPLLAALFAAAWGLIIKVALPMVDNIIGKKYK